MKPDWERKYKTGNEEKPLSSGIPVIFPSDFRFSANCALRQRDVEFIFERDLLEVGHQRIDPHVPAALEGKLDLAGMVTRRIGLDEAPRALDELRASTRVVRSVILF